MHKRPISKAKNFSASVRSRIGLSTMKINIFVLSVPHKKEFIGHSEAIIDALVICVMSLMKVGCV